MRSTLVRLAAALAVSVALSSCGGLSSALSQTGSFQGAWNGSASANGVSGTISLNIDQNNNVSGGDTISKPTLPSTDTGTIDNNGNLSLTCTYNGATVATITAVMVAAGTALTSTSGTIAYTGGSSYPLTLNLSLNPLVQHKN